MSSRQKPWYFERDCPVCTRSASSFCRNPLYSFAHAMWAKWWYHAKFRHFQSSFCSDFQFHGHLAQNKYVNACKIANDVRKFWKLMTSLFMVCRERKNVWSCNKLKKMKCPCNRWVLVRNTDTSKEIVQFVHEVRPVFAVTLSTLLHILCGWNDDTMPSFNIFTLHFLVIFNFRVI